MTPSTVVRMTSKSAGNSDATSADSLSLSPNLISVNDTASFSLMIGHDAAAEQRDERVARVEMALVMFEVVVREQHLRDVQAVRGKKFVVNRHEPRLADGGAGLQFGEFGRALFVAERAHARADRAAGDEHDFLAGLAQRGDLRDELLQAAPGRAACGCR